MQIQQLAIDELIPYARNSRTHSPEQISEIAASIDEFGMVGAIVVRNGVIAKGHGTLSALRMLMDAGKQIYPAPGKAAGAMPLPHGMVPAIDASGWTDAQFRAYVIADNKIALNAGWDNDMLAIELGDLSGMDFDLSLLGFSDEELQNLTSEPDFEPGSEDDQGKLDELSPKMVTCPHCNTEWDLREHGQG